jgi:cytokinesis protein
MISSSADADNSTWPTFSQPPRHSQQSHHHSSLFQTHHVSGFSSTASFSPDGFHLPRPSNDKVIEREFLELMHKRGWHNLPEQARRQMLAYPAAKKWTLVYQDKLTEWQGEQRRRQHARQTGYGNADGVGLLGRAEEEGSPEWFVKKVLDDSITPKQLQSLSVSLRTQPIRYACYSLHLLVTMAGSPLPPFLISIRNSVLGVSLSAALV